MTTALIARVVGLAMLSVAGLYALSAGGCSPQGWTNHPPQYQQVAAVPAPQQQPGVAPVPGPTPSRHAVNQSVGIAQGVSDLGNAAAAYPVVGPYAEMAERFGDNYADEVAWRQAVQDRLGANDIGDDLVTGLMGLLAGVGGALGFRRRRPGQGPYGPVAAQHPAFVPAPSHITTPGVVPTAAAAPAQGQPAT